MARFKGTEGDDSYTLHAKRDIVKMLGGDDTVYLSAATLQSDDRISGGKGQDEAILNDGGFYNLGHGHFTGFETLTMFGRGDFEVYLDDSVAAAGTTLTISGDELVVGQFHLASLFVDGAAERDASLLMLGSTGDDTLIGGGGADTIEGSQGRDLMTGNEGSDTFVFTGRPAGDTWGKDRITDFHPGEDHLTFRTNSVTSFDQLLLQETADGLVVRTPNSGSQITLMGVSLGELQARDVSFEPMPSSAVEHHALAIPHDHGILA
jgi:Ca2+-binding RTX toxin-like protein